MLFKNLPLPVVKPGLNQEDLLILLILLKYVIMLGKMINLDFIVFQIKIVITILEVAKMFGKKLDFYLLEKVRDMHQL